MVPDQLSPPPFFSSPSVSFTIMTPVESTTILANSAPPSKRCYRLPREKRYLNGKGRPGKGVMLLPCGRKKKEGKQYNKELAANGTDEPSYSLFSWMFCLPAFFTRLSSDSCLVFFPQLLQHLLLFQAPTDNNTPPPPPVSCGPLCSHGTATE